MMSNGTAATAPASPAVRHPDDFKALREVLFSANYTDSAILNLLNAQDVASIGEKDIALLRRRTDDGSPLSTLVRLFLIDTPCDFQSVKAAVHPMDVTVWIDAGIVRPSGDGIRAQVRLMPFKNLFIAFDPPRRLTQTDQAHAYVMGIGKSTLTLANAMIDRPCRSALDLGTGCGVLAFLAAGFSDRVIGVDRNPRAVAMAAFNAGISGIAQVDFREGNLFAPVDGDRFDRIVTNPPFVISPESAYIYRDGGMPGDDLCRTIASQVPARLNEGGYCQMLCKWIEKEGVPWGERLREWFAGSGCDVWVMRSESRSADAYAATWIRHTEKARTEDYERQFDRWMACYDEQQIASIGAGIITMRRRSAGPNWFRAEASPKRMLGACGQAIVDGFACRDLTAAIGNDAAWLQLRVKPSPEMRIEQWSQPADQGWQSETVRLHLVKGLAYTGDIDPYVAGMVMRCNGQTPLAVLLRQMADALGEAPETIAAPFCKITRGMVEQGFLLPVDPP